MVWDSSIIYRVHPPVRNTDQSLLNVGPASATLAQHETNIGCTCRMYLYHQFATRWDGSIIQTQAGRHTHGRLVKSKLYKSRVNKKETNPLLFSASPTVCIQIKTRDISVLFSPARFFFNKILISLQTMFSHSKICIYIVSKLCKVK